MPGGCLANCKQTANGGDDAVEPGSQAYPGHYVIRRRNTSHLTSPVPLHHLPIRPKPLPQPLSHQQPNPVFFYLPPSPSTSLFIVVIITHGDGFVRPDCCSSSYSSRGLTERLPNMKGALLTAAVLLGSAQGAVHKMKLQKVPLSEQLVCMPLSLPVSAKTIGH